MSAVLEISCKTACGMFNMQLLHAFCRAKVGQMSSI